MIPLTRMRAVPETSDHDLGQYYRSTYVIVQEDGLYVVRYVTSVDDGRLELDNEHWVDVCECYLFMPRSGWYGGMYISMSAQRHYKKGIPLSVVQVMPLQRYLNTGVGYSEFHTSGDRVYYHNCAVGLKENTSDGEVYLFTNQELATRFQKEFKKEVVYEI